jgi:hypothetical protein
MGKRSAVLTGDLIDSTRAEASRIDHSMNLIQTAVPFLMAEAEGSRFSRFTRYRGDGWQIYLEDPGTAIWVAVYLNAVLRADPRSLPTRIAIGIGGIEHLGSTGLSAASGAAFIASGRALDKMAAGQTLALAGEKTDDIQRNLIAFMARLMTEWSREQAEVVRLMIKHGDPNQTEIAEKLGISRQAVSLRLQSSGYRLLQNAAFAFRDVYERAE